jgi:hypothetical protein
MSPVERMQNAKQAMQNSKCGPPGFAFCIACFAFCILRALALAAGGRD